MHKIFFMLLLLPAFVYGECVQEFMLAGNAARQLVTNDKVTYFAQVDGRFVPLNQVRIDSDKEYLIQVVPTVTRDDYNKKYLQYYNYKRLNDYLAEKKPQFTAKGYRLEVIGQSVEKRNLYIVYPETIDKSKKTVVMFCRHHGDEGTANWIVEGFVNTVFQDENWGKFYQLILYPMINPDGAEKRTRYNANGYDLNRCWGNGRDEAGIVREHVFSMQEQFGKVETVLDMHGSWNNDFIYRVPQYFIDLDFFELQGKFINELAMFDSWQAGAFQLSTGDPGMSRIYLIQKFRYNALTHETIRNINKNNSKGRNLDSLKGQGIAVFRTLMQPAPQGK